MGQLELSHHTDTCIRLRDNGVLRPLGEKDVTQSYVDGLNNPAVSEFLVGENSGKETLQSVTAFVARNMADESGLLFGLYVDDVHRGNVRLHDCRDGIAWLGIAIFDRSIWGEGWGSEAIRAVAGFAIAELGVSIIKAGVDDRNLASERAFSKAGFAQEYQDEDKGTIWCLMASNSPPA